MNEVVETDCFLRLEVADLHHRRQGSWYHFVPYPFGSDSLQVYDLRCSVPTG